MHRPGIFDQAVGAKTDLVGRLFAAGIEHRAPRRLEPGCGLQQECRLPDSRLSPDQRHRAGDDSTAQHEVELVEAGAPTLE
jgi:hypothetical protein